VKFQGPQKEEFIKAIRAHDREKLWELITHQEVSILHKLVRIL
jgi:hypothetical protein